MKSSPPLREVPRLLWRRLRREVHARTAPRQPHPLRPHASAQALAARLHERAAPRFFGPLAAHAALIAEQFPEVRTLVIAQAEAARAHRFDLLGSGEVDLGPQINWHADFKSGHVWPLEHHTRLILTAPQGGFDVKVPWELSRFHHVLRLGQAYLLTGEEAYAQEVVDQVAHWIAANPCEFGVNWAGPMDVAIRAVNWLWAYHLIAGAAALTPDFLTLWLASLCQHGDYLLAHLEDGWPRTNHLIANLVGLLYLGLLLPEFPRAARWRRVGWRLWGELLRQVLPDGVDDEASLPYHRLVAEMALHAAALCALNGLAVPQGARDRLAAMLEVIAACTQPDGTAPIIGDADDGRLLPLGAHADPDRAASDYRYLLALGSLVLDDAPPTWAALAGDQWQDALWCFGAEALARYGAAQHRRAPTLSSCAFPQGGLYVMRHADLHLTLRAGGVGQEGVGGHAHNDVFSLTLAVGRPLLIDPGSYTYTANPQVRNTFRSTAYHNTLQVEGEEINRLSPDPFRLHADARVSVHRWISTPHFDFFDGSHDGYARLEAGVIHRRRVWFDKTAGLWIVHDGLIPVGKAAQVEVALWFHFAPLRVRIEVAHNALRTADTKGTNLLILPLGDFPLRAALEMGQYAPRYGIGRIAPVAKFGGRVKLPAEWALLLYPFRKHLDLEAAREAGQAALAALTSVTM